MRQHFNKGRKHPNRKKPEPFSEIHKLNMSKVKKGKKPKNLEWLHEQSRIDPVLRNKINLSISKAKTGKPQLFNRGEKSNLWKGGVSSLNSRIRDSIEYKLWRNAVFIRDEYTCVWCCKKGVILHADHIKPFAFYPELRFSIDNGRTLCLDCHKKTETYLNNKKI